MCEHACVCVSVYKERKRESVVCCLLKSEVCRGGCGCEGELLCCTWSLINNGWEGGEG